MRFRTLWTRSLRGKTGGISSREGRMLRLAGTSLAGIGWGAFFVSRQWLTDGIELSLLLERYAPRERTAWFACVGEAFASVLPYVLLLVLSGLTIFGGVAVPLVLFFHGLGLGTILGSLYRFFGWEGVLYSLLILLPYGFFTIGLLLMVAKDSVTFSRRLTMQTMEKSAGEGSSRTALKKYLLRCAIYGGILLILSMLQGTLRVWCGGWIPLNNGM